ncbi:MAG: hypothetical protein AAGD40_12440 [Pseudomonadota bacterium]
MPVEGDALTAIETAVESMILAAESGDPDMLDAAVTRQATVIAALDETTARTLPDFIARLRTLKTRNELAGRKLAVALDGVRRRRSAMAAIATGDAPTYGRDGTIHAR